jgi:ligand-binding SRPBCC domain-containing protein
VHRFSHSFAVDAEIGRVWDFYTDIGHLEVITPPEMRLKVLTSTTGRKIAQGTEVWIEGRLVTKSRWHSRITYMQPYTYVDEMLSGRFRSWKHVHAFRRLDGGTEIMDEIDFQLPYGLLGKMLEGYVYRTLAKVFAHRKEATINALR